MKVSLTFEQLREMQRPHWSTHELEGQPFWFSVEPYTDIGEKVFLVRQGGYLIKSLPDAPDKYASICHMLGGRIIVSMNGKTIVFEPHTNPTFLASNILDAEVIHQDVEMLFFQVEVSDDFKDYYILVDMVNRMIEDFHLSFEKIYRAVNEYGALGPLRRQLGSLDRMSAKFSLAAQMLAHFSSGNFQLKSLAHAVGLSIPTISRTEIAGRKVTDWADVYKINLWRASRKNLTEREVADLLGYSSSAKMKVFLKRHGLDQDLT